MKRLIFLTVALVAAPVFAQPSAPGLPNVKKEARQQRRDARKGLKEAKREVREARKGDRTGLEEAKRDLREAKKGSRKIRKRKMTRALTKDMSPEEKKSFKNRMRAQRKERVSKWKALSPEQRKVVRKERRGERKARAKSRRESAREKARALSGGETPSKDLKKEFRRHAKRMARLDRVESVATESGDEKVLERVGTMQDKERTRHAAWLSQLKNIPSAPADAKQMEN